MSDKVGKESQYMVSHPELGSDPPIGSDRESGRDTTCSILCSSGLQNIYKLHMWKCSTFTLFTKRNKKTYTLYQKSSNGPLLMC